jgi:hypothetical protein
MATEFKVTAREAVLLEHARKREVIEMVKNAWLTWT